MKVRFLFLFALFTSVAFAQSINNFKAVIVPLKFDFQKNKNEYRLSTMTKHNLSKAGFEVYYNEEPNSYDKCSLLYVDVINLKSFLATKMYFVLKDCNGKEIFRSATGYSKEKEYPLAYKEVLEEAFASLYARNYKYEGSTAVVDLNPSTSNVAVPAPIVATSAVVPAVVPISTTAAAAGAEVYYAQPTSNGYQLVDTTPKVIMKLYKTSKSDYFTAIKGNVQGVLFLKDNNWFFEYYQNEQLMSEKIAIKF
ncbi:hypothetical protein SAMN05444143_101719 [Flavobacterium succinicans]|uniref:Uncharacterized protein n=1 Tax=Flavobacterium succinicans TaxID=29536 RepID=A0A1I4S8A8_9FLAO|nr:hypothetical protein [Flavobacterium succinicans]SFM60735.1 hypothetical protein SAMN05444143_101719 [Flavobacterium succinicans]